MSTTATPGQSESRLRMSTLIRDNIDQEVAELAESTEDEEDYHKKYGFMEQIQSYYVVLNLRYCKQILPVSSYEIDLHDLWYHFITAAKVVPVGSATQNSLVHQVLYIREFGTMKSSSDESAITKDSQRMWTDLPYLVEDLRAAWAASMALSPIRRRNLAGFTARLAAVGVRDGDLAFCALWLFRETLESSKREGRSGAADDTASDVTIDDLLPACIAWFRFGGHKLLRLCVSGPSCPPTNENDTWATPGELAQSAGITQPGFSISRWLFWRKRLIELTRSEDKDLATKAKHAFSNSIGIGRQIGVVVPGDAKYWETVMRLMEEELKRSGKTCVTDDDVEIDLRWSLEDE